MENRSVNLFIARQVYEGLYAFGPFEAEVRTSRNRLLLRSPPITFGGSLVLAYKQPLRFQVCLPSAADFLQRTLYVRDHHST